MMLIPQIDLKAVAARQSSVLASVDMARAAIISACQRGRLHADINVTMSLSDTVIKCLRDAGYEVSQVTSTYIVVRW